MKRSSLFQLFVILFITLFCALGTWQLYRLQWKTELISEITFGLDSTPVKYSNTIKKNYQRVVSEGKFNFEDQIYYYEYEYTIVDDILFMAPYDDDVLLEDDCVASLKGLTGESESYYNDRINQADANGDIPNWCN